MRATIRLLSLLHEDARVRHALRSRALLIILFLFLKTKAASKLSEMSSRALDALLTSSSSRDKRASSTTPLRALATFAIGVFLLSPVDYVFHYVVRSTRAVLSHRLVELLSEARVGRMSEEAEETVIASGADRFVDLALDLSVEVVEAIFHMIVFLRVLQEISPPLAGAALATSLVGTTTSLTLGARLPTLFRLENEAQGSLVYQITRSRENAESIQFYDARATEVAKTVALDKQKQQAVLNRKAAKDASEWFSNVLRRLSGGILPFYFLAAGNPGGHSNSSSRMMMTNVPGAIKPHRVKGDEHAHSHDGSHGHSHSHHEHSHDGSHGHSHSRHESSSPLSRVLQAKEAFDDILFHMLFASENLHNISRLNATAEDIVALLEKKPEASSTANKIELKIIDERHFSPSEHHAPWLVLKNVSVFAGPDRALLRGLSFELKYGDSLLISGISGVGKTALLRVICGIWTRGEGYISRPGGCLFLPQRPYCTIGSLRAQIVYPLSLAEGRGIDDERAREALRSVGLGRLLQDVVALTKDADPLDRVEKWSDLLSLGEQQRLAFARVLYHRPRFLFLDEATSALDVASEQSIYALVEKVCEGGFVSVGHRASIERFHLRKLVLKPDASWEFQF